MHPFAGAAYATSKAALAALTREMAHDFGPLGVRVNAIAPGEVETAILSPGTDKIVEKLPMQRLGQPKEVADVDLVPVLGPVELYLGRRDRGERRAARLRGAELLEKPWQNPSKDFAPPYSSVAMIARSVSIPSPFSDEVTTISG